MNNRKKIFIGIGIALAVLVFIALALRQGQRGGIEVRTEEVKRRDLMSVVTASGRIRPHVSVDIQAELEGRIVDLRIEEGDLAEKGDTLLIIDPTEFKAAVQRAQASMASARASVARARADRDQARRSLERTRKIRLQSPELISDQQLEAAETNFDVQQALLEAAEFDAQRAQANLQEARSRLAKTVIIAPMSGRVTRVNRREGESAAVRSLFVNPVMLVIADLSEMEAVVEVDETDIPEIELGDSTSVEIDAYRNEPFRGQVTEIAQSSIQGEANSQSGASSEESVDFEVVIALDDPPSELRPDLSVTADIVTAMRDSVLSIPIISLTLRPRPEIEEEAPRETGGELIELAPEGAPEDEEGVYVVENGVATFRWVKVGIAGRDYFEVLEGLEEGEVIVAGSYQAIRQLKDGSRVKVRGRHSSKNRSQIRENAGSEEGTAAVALAATVESEPAPEPAAGSELSQRALPYSVLIASLSSYDDALARQREWARPDLTVYVVPTAVRGATYNRIFAGVLPDRDVATQLMKVLAREGLKETVQDWDVRPTRLAFLFGTFDRAEEADEKTQELMALGVPAYAVAASSAGMERSAYHVYAGGYEEAQDARPLLERIARVKLNARLVEREGVVYERTDQKSQGKDK